MKILILLSGFLISHLAFAGMCDISPFAEIQKIAENPLDAQRACLKSLAFDPASPPVSKQPFIKMSGKDVFAINCTTDDDDTHDRYLFITDEGLKHLKLPFYKYPVGGDTATLPRNVVHFTSGTENYYMSFTIVGQPKVDTVDKIPALSAEYGYSVNQIKNEFIKKYEDHLKSKNLLSAIKLRAPNEAETEELLPCLENRQSVMLSDYLSMKFNGAIPSYNTIVGHHN